MQRVRMVFSGSGGQGVITAAIIFAEAAVIEVIHKHYPDHAILAEESGVPRTVDPLRLAYDGALLDQMSDGRFVLGVGVGIAPVMKRYGVPPEEAGSRMDDTMRMLKALWSGADHYDGQHFSQKGVVIPGPVQPGGIWRVTRNPRNPTAQTRPMTRPNCRCPHSHQ
mgnify:CR=1 FL=1